MVGKQSFSINLMPAVQPSAVWTVLQNPPDTGQGSRVGKLVRLPKFRDFVNQEHKSMDKLKSLL